MENIYNKLAAIQSALKAPKTQENKSVGYMYRKVEDILEAVKPLLAKNGCTLTCTDELILVGDRYYIKATATVTSTEDGSCVSTTAYAREEESKKGMDGSQVTGASSSYARKYALNGLLCIDDTADSDTTNTGDSEVKPAPKKKAKAADGIDTSALVPGGADYLKIVSAYARGLRTKAGENYRDVWCKLTNANDSMLEAFDHDVATYRLEHNIQPAF